MDEYCFVHHTSALDVLFYWRRNSQEIGDTNSHGDIGKLGCPLQRDVLVNQQHVVVVTKQQVYGAIFH